MSPDAHRPVDGPARPRRSLLRAAAGLSAAGLLSACGFRPLYGEGSAAGGDVVEALGRIDVAPIREREGQMMRALLLRRLNPSGRPADPDYELRVSLSESTEDLGIRRDDTATRANLTLRARIELRDIEADEVVLARSLDTVTSYNILDDLYATLAVERDARERAIQSLSETIRTQVALYFARAGTAEPQGRAADDTG
ncbi:MAG: LPS assembly lipoprotein LptE [Azospirillaceae bacterium]